MSTMPDTNYELAASTWGQEEIDAINGVIQSGRFTMGEQVAAFEREFASYFGMKHALMVNSGSSANLVAVAALFYKRENPLQKGDEVIVPSISWSTTYHPLQQYGLKLRFIDVELDTLNMDVSKLEAALTPRTRMIVAVSILGNPAALDVMRTFAKKHDLYLFEDNCESMDAELAGQKTGTFGLVNTFSTFFSHHISTMEGGLLLTDSDEIAHLGKCIRNHGWTRDLPPDSSLYERSGSDHFEAYRFIMPGYNVRPIEMAGATGRAQLKKLPAMTAKRRENWALFQEIFGNDERFIIQRENGKSSAFSFTMIIRPDARAKRDEIWARLRKNDIGFRIITGGCFLRHDCIKYFDYDTVGDVVNANIAHDYGFFVGNHPFDLTPQLEHLHKVLKTI
jgi:CDP-6-deoxy-D-xylo-4-hexulose-3-dehydrase